MEVARSNACTYCHVCGVWKDQTVYHHVEFMQHCLKACLNPVSTGVARETGLIPGAPPNADGLLGLAPHGSGRIAIYGDSGCLDASHQRTACHGLLTALLAYVTEVGVSFERNLHLMRTQAVADRQR